MRLLGRGRASTVQMIILIAILLAVLYFGALYAAPGIDKSATETAAASREVKVFRNFFISILIFFALDAAIFHSGLYQSILRPNSYAGRVSGVVREEKQRKASGLKEILLVGDSRIGRGFAEEIANKTGTERGVKFFKRPVPGSNPRVWYYLLREIDPFASRYQAVVMPFKFDSSERPDNGVLDVVTAAPLLRYSDAYTFASSFREWKDQCRAFIACFLRGSAFQSDISDLLEHPLKRVTELQKPSRIPNLGTQDPKQDDVDLFGMTHDPMTNQIKVPDRVTQSERASAERALQSLPTQDGSGHQYRWTDQILERYASSRTPIVVVTMPRGPFGGVQEWQRQDVDKLLHNKRVIMLDEHEFEFLERPEYFVDNVHLNAKGRRLFTERLSEEVLARLKSAEASRDQRGVPDRFFER